MEEHGGAARRGSVPAPSPPHWAQGLLLGAKIPLQMPPALLHPPEHCGWAAGRVWGRKPLQNPPDEHFCDGQMEPAGSTAPSHPARCASGRGRRRGRAPSLLLTLLFKTCRLGPRWLQLLRSHICPLLAQPAARGRERLGSSPGTHSHLQGRQEAPGKRSARARGAGSSVNSPRPC